MTERSTPGGAGAADHAPLPDNLRAYLEEPRYAAIATLDEDGSPRQAIIWYAVRADGSLLVNSRRERIWPRNLGRDPRVHVAVMDADRPVHWVGGAGRAEFLHDGREALEDIAALARRYDSDPEKYAGQDRVSFAIRILRPFEYGG